MIFSTLSAPLRVHLATQYPPAASISERTIISSTGMTAVWNEAHTHLAPVGCALCFGGDYGQNVAGNPTLQGRELLRAEENMNLGGALGPSVRANLWLCPACQMPQARLLPRFL